MLEYWEVWCTIIHLMKTFEDLDAWKMGMDLVEEIYKITSQFPPEERYGLTQQMRRASTSVVANIGEGFGRYTFPDKAHKYTIARGECIEVRAFLLIAMRLGFVKDAKTAIELTNTVGRLLNGLIQSCKRRS